MVSPAYVPDKGHIIKINFNPQAGHEQAGWRPALVLSPAVYNKHGLAIVVPVIPPGALKAVQGHLMLLLSFPKP